MTSRESAPHGELIEALRTHANEKVAEWPITRGLLLMAADTLARSETATPCLPADVVLAMTMASERLRDGGTFPVKGESWQKLTAALAKHATPQVAQAATPAPAPVASTDGTSGTEPAESASSSRCVAAAPSKDSVEAARFIVAMMDRHASVTAQEALMAPEIVRLSGERPLP